MNRTVHPGNDGQDLQATPAGGQKVLLIVDDEFLIRWSLRNRLTTAGYRVLEAETAEAGRSAFGQGVDIVLLDLKLPDGNGLELLEEFRRRDPETRIVMISAHATDEVVAQARARGASEFLHKPFDLDLVTALVDRVSADPR